MRAAEALSVENQEAVSRLLIENARGAQVTEVCCIHPARLQLKFTDMANVVSATMDQLIKDNLLNNSIEIEAVMEIDKYARLLAQKNIKNFED